MSRHFKICTIFATFGQFAVEILVICMHKSLFFCDFSLISNVFIDINEYVNKIIRIFTQ